MSTEVEASYKHLVSALINEKPLSYIKSLVNTNPQLLLWQDHFGNTALHYATVSGSPPKMVEYLVGKCPESAAIVNKDRQTALHYACFYSHKITTIQLLLDSFPRGAQMQRDHDGATPLHIACESLGEPDAIRRLMLAWPVACLIYSKQVEERYLPVLPLDVAEQSSKSPLHVAALDDVAQTTIDAFYGLIDAVFHHSSGLPRQVVALVERYISSQMWATIKANGMITKETIDLATIKDLLKNEAIQTMLKEETIATVIHGFIQMNSAGRKEAMKDGADKRQNIAVCASVSNNVSCVLAHLQDNPLLCQRHTNS